MAAKLPIVSSNAGGNPEAITDNETGLIFDVHDSSQMIETLRKMITDNKLACRFGQNAQTAAFRKYTLDHWIDQHEQYYQDIIHL